MPLISINGSDAVSTMKRNSYSTWPNRSDNNNRVEPFTEPAIAPNFKIPKGASIFTIGSCFARNVENALKKRGFNIVSHSILKSNPVFSEFGPNILNNYGVPSIYNELSWALDEDKLFNAEKYIEEIFPNKYVDMHLNQALKPASKVEVLARREAIHEMNKQILNCQLLIITLGLSEVWWDKKHCIYLNTSPRRSIIRNNPDRFEVHVLSTDEMLNYLRPTLDLVKHNCPDIKTVITVSPVPLQSTYTEKDVIIANMYSKSSLRVVAEHLVNEYDDVDYYPSYESIIISDRSDTWEADMTHPTKEVIYKNVERMVNDYTHSPEVKESDSVEIISKELKNNHSLSVQQILSKYLPIVELDEKLSLRYAEACISEGNYTDAEKIIKKCSNLWSRNSSTLLRCWLNLNVNYSEEIISELKSLENSCAKERFYWPTVFSAYEQNNDFDAARWTASKWIKNFPRSVFPFLRMAKYAKCEGNTELYNEMLERALEVDDSSSIVLLEYVEHLLNEEKYNEARMCIKNIEPSNRAQMERYNSLLFSLGLDKKSA